MKSAREPGAVDCACGAIEMLREISAVVDGVKHTRSLCVALTGEHDWEQTGWEYDDSFFTCRKCHKKTNSRRGYPNMRGCPK